MRLFISKIIYNKDGIDEKSKIKIITVIDFTINSS